MRMGASADIAVVESEEMFLSADLDTIAKLDEENKEVAVLSSPFFTL